MHDKDPREAVLAQATNTLAVVRVDGHYRVLAARAHAKGARLLELEGVVITEASRHSVQVGVDRHLEAPRQSDLEQSLDRMQWRFLNHSCRPNAAFQGRTLVAIDDILPWEQVTFDYNTTEWMLATPFECHCGAAICCGIVQGYQALNADGRRLREPHVAQHLRDLVDGD